SPVLRADRNDEAIVAQGDVVLAGFRVARAKNLFQRLLDGVAGLRDAGANSAQGRGSVVADFAVWQDATANRCQHVAKIGERCRACCEQWEFRRLLAKVVTQPS